MDKVRSTLRQMIRDWSDAVSLSYIAIPTRNFDLRPWACIYPGRAQQNGKRPINLAWTRWRSTLVTSPRKTGQWIGKALLDRHAHRSDSRSSVKVLVPGAGLGRMALEFAHRGMYRY